MPNQSIAPDAQNLDALKKSNEYSAEYWSARDLQSMLGYSQWRRFEDAIKRAMISCETSGNDPTHHFAGAGKPISGGKGAIQMVDDYHLSRFACYLIAQNGDPRKPEIAQAQKYFAIQTRRQELSEQAAADKERLELGKQTSEEFKALSGAAYYWFFEWDLGRKILKKDGETTFFLDGESCAGVGSFEFFRARRRKHPACRLESKRASQLPNCYSRDHAREGAGTGNRHHHHTR